MKVRKAIVLAAGHGTRLRPFTCATPKPLMPVWGEPMLGRIVAMLRSWGVDDIAFNTHCLHEQVKAWADGYRRGASAAGDKVKIKVSYEPEILGTGGVLNPLREWIADEPFYLVNGDIVVENAPNPIDKIRNFESNAVIGVALVSESGPRTIEVEPESGFVTNWRSQDAGCDGTYTYCGITVLKPEILKFVKPEGFSSIVSAYEDAMMHGKFVKAVKSREMLWTDAGTIPSYIDLNRDGDDNAFTDIPQVKAALEAAGSKPDSSVEFIGARGSERVFFRCDKGVIILYDDGNRDENGLYAGHARFLKSRGVPVPEVLADLPSIKDYSLVMDDLPENGAGTMPDHDVTVTYKYTRVTDNADKTVSKVNVIYMLEDGSVIETDTLTGQEGEQYSVQQNEYEDRMLVEVPPKVNGTFGAGEINVILNYVNKPDPMKKILVVVAIGVGVIFVLCIASAIASSVKRKKKLRAAMDFNNSLEPKE